MGALVAFILTAPTAFVLGWLARGFTDRHLKGIRMHRKIALHLDRLLDWLGDTRKLTVLVVVTAAAVLSSIVYTWSADQQSENRTDDVMACIARYVAEQSEAQAPRTVAANAATDARTDWDQGYSEDFPRATKDELKARYLYLAHEAERVRDDNPLPKFDRAFCEESLG